MVTISRLVWRLVSAFALVILCLAGAAGAKAQGCTGVAPSVTGSVSWTPQWCQEFNATVPGAPDASAWTYDLGNGGFGNNEVETYCGPMGTQNNPASCPTTFSTSMANAYVDGNGHLVIQAINNGGAWTSARMKTQGLQNFQYGRIEASIQLPDTTNQGLWPAFWTLGSNINTTPWPACGETDILEVWSPAVLNGPGPFGNRATLHTTATDGAGVQPNGAFTFPNAQTNSSAFHTYGMIWSANMQQFYVDNPQQPYYIATASDLKASDAWPFNLQFFLIMNVAVGGTLGGTPSASTRNPGILMADYVRQYSGKVVAPTLGNPPAISIKAGATTGNTSTFTPGVAAGSGFTYFTCDTSAPKASCAISTTDPLNAHVVNSNAAETVTATVTSAANSSTGAPAAKIRKAMPKQNAALATMAGMLGILFYLLARRTGEFPRRNAWTLAAGFACLSAMIAGCGGNSVVAPPSDGTAPGAYVVDVYAFTETNSGDGTNAQADAQVAIPLTVN